MFIRRLLDKAKVLEFDAKAMSRDLTFGIIRRNIVMTTARQIAAFAVARAAIDHDERGAGSHRGKQVVEDRSGRGQLVIGVHDQRGIDRHCRQLWIAAFAAYDVQARESCAPRSYPQERERQPAKIDGVYASSRCHARSGLKGTAHLPVTTDLLQRPVFSSLNAVSVTGWFV